MVYVGPGEALGGDTNDLFLNLSFILPIPTESPYYNQARMQCEIATINVQAEQKI
jgi:hypothetical protein